MYTRRFLACNLPPLFAHTLFRQITTAQKYNRLVAPEKPNIIIDYYLSLTQDLPLIITFLARGKRAFY